MAILYGTLPNGSLVPVEADAQGRLVAELDGGVPVSNWVRTGTTLSPKVAGDDIETSGELASQASGSLAFAVLTNNSGIGGRVNLKGSGNTNEGPGVFLDSRVQEYVVFTAANYVRNSLLIENTTNNRTVAEFGHTGNVHLNNVAGLTYLGPGLASNPGTGIARLQVQDNGGWFAEWKLANGSSVGGVQWNGGNGVTYHTTSDYRLKTKVEPISLDSAERSVLALKPCTYEWKSLPGKSFDGFIAHEVQAIFPNAVTGEKDAVDEQGEIKAQMMATQDLFPSVVAALQSALRRVEALENELQALKGGR